MLGEKWKALSEDDRGPYKEKAIADGKRYEEEKKNYKVSKKKAYFLRFSCVY